MLGEVREQYMPILTGTGANGKGVFRDAILAAFGDYAIEVDPKLLMETKHDRHGTFLMELRGRRLVFCSETERGRRFAESTMKRLTGGDPIQANRMHKDPITFQPSHTLIMITNHLPAISGDDPAVARRLLVIPFDVIIPEAERDTTLPEKMRAESPGIMRWALEGWLAYQRDGLNPPETVQARTRAYLSDQDIIGRFTEEQCIVGAGNHVGARELYQAYAKWCAQSGERVLTEKEFSTSMAGRGVEKNHTKTGKRYQGIGLYVEEPDDENQDESDGYDDTKLWR